MILNVYKEKGWTSFDVVKKLRGMLGIKKIGHAGTLDPLAEGVLVVLTEKDTKKQNEIMKLQKEYEATIAFGATTDSYDLEQPLDYTSKGADYHNLRDKPAEIEKLLAELSTSIETILPTFMGEIKQKVPAHSAVKVDGKRLYKKARKGTILESDVPEKDVVVYDLQMESINFDKEFNLPVAKFVITCGKGFYVRSFANDLGKQLGVGGVLINLVRTRVGDYTVSESKPITSFETVI